MTVEGKVSVIVPVYKVENYIHRCLSSIIQQTYANLEIILVNDGSPDNCGEIIEDYAQKDSRIKVIHKENGGLSDARNEGIKAVTGVYTMFIDSDDWVAKNLIETLLSLMIKHKTDIAQSSFYYAYDDQLLLDQRYFTENHQAMIYDNNQLMKALLKNEKVKNFAWAKLYKTELIKDIPFKKGILFEDVYWSYQVMSRAKSYLICDLPLYYYYQRKDSIVATYTSKSLDMIEGLRIRHQFINVRYPELIALSYQSILKHSLIHYDLLVRNFKIDGRKKYRKKIESYLLANKQKLKEAARDEKELLFQFNLFLIHPYLKMAYLGLRKGLRALKMLPKPKGLVKIKRMNQHEVIG